MNSRRSFLFTMTALVLPVVARAQTSGKVHRLGIIVGGSTALVPIDGLRQGLRDHGLEEGKNLVLDIRHKAAAGRAQTPSR